MIDIKWKLNRESCAYERWVKRGKVKPEHSGSIDLINAKRGHGCGGDLYEPVGLPPTIRRECGFAVCWKCAAEVRI